MWLLAAFIAVPLIEIALFIQVGGILGLWPTLLVVLLTAVAGTVLVRSEGLAALANIQKSLERLDDPATPLAHGAMILVSGVLLLTPGFFTDAIGFALLIPAVRDRVIAALRARMTVHAAHMRTGVHDGAAHRREPGVIDGEFHEVDPDNIPPRRGDAPSGWSRD